ncbi:hypothetical protein TNCV_215731 [Trichonephila clavipes]|nr:hypothetical protein TNCV_215731 [Trichonephila clavipes]
MLLRDVCNGTRWGVLRAEEYVDRGGLGLAISTETCNSRIKEIASRINMEEAEKYYIIRGLKENRAIEIHLQSCSHIEELKEKIKLLDIQEKSKSS